MLDPKILAGIKNTILYIPDKGEFVRKANLKPAYLKPNKNASPRLLVLGKEYAAKSVACFLMTGDYPNKFDVKSLDGNKDNLMWSNLYRVKLGHKFCVKCKEEKPLSEYHFRDSKHAVRKAECRECIKPIYAASHRRRNMRSYGLTIEQYENMQATQGGCAICGGADKGKRLAVDHCHTTNKVRGLLCGQCNQGLGMFKDNPGLLVRAAEYIKNS